MKVVNLTPHAVTLIHMDGHSETFPSAGEARAEEILGDPWSPNTTYPIPVRGPTRYGSITGLPPRLPEPTVDEMVSGVHTPPDAVYIVSHIVAERLREQTRDERLKEWGKDIDLDRWFKRDDIVTPSGLVRDPQGRVIGCRSFASLW